MNVCFLLPQHHMRQKLYPEDEDEWEFYSAVIHWRNMKTWVSLTGHRCEMCNPTWFPQHWCNGPRSLVVLWRWSGAQTWVLRAWIRWWRTCYLHHHHHHQNVWRFVCLGSGPPPVQDSYQQWRTHSCQLEMNRSDSEHSIMLRNWNEVISTCIWR